VHARRRADDVAPLEPAIAAGEIADPSSRLVTSSDPAATSPRRQMQLEEAVEHARCGVREIERGGTGAANALRDEMMSSKICV